MEGSHQKGSNWYRCQYVYKRGIADAAGHPRVLGIKEDAILDPLFDFLGRRLFGPDRLRLLRDELAHTVADGWHDHEALTATLTRKLSDNQRAVHRQTLRLEEHDDPNHPVVAAAKQRLETLAKERASIEEQLGQPQAQRPLGVHPDESRARRDPRSSASTRPLQPRRARRALQCVRRDRHLRQAQPTHPARSHRHHRTRPTVRNPATASKPVAGFWHSGGGIWTHFPDRLIYHFTETRAL